MDILKRFLKDKLPFVIMYIFAAAFYIYYIINRESFEMDYANAPILRQTKYSAFKIEAPILILIVVIPNLLQYLSVLMDMIFKKQKKIIITNTSKISFGVFDDSEEKPYYWHAKDKRKIYHRFVVYNDVYSLKAKKKTNTYEVTYFRFSKVVTEIKKVKPDKAMTK